jgi:Ca2+-binding EF-hand superfamily protein
LPAAVPGTQESTEAADALFDKLDSDSDGQVTQNELSSMISKLADQLNAQFDQSRVAQAGGSRPHGGPPPGGPPPGPPPTDESADATATAAYITAADTDADGTVSSAEAEAWTAQVNGPDEQDEGLSKADLTEMLDSTSPSDLHARQGLSQLVDNFDDADSDGDGMLTRVEGKIYLKENRTDGVGNSGDTISALAKALQLLKTYIAERDSSIDRTSTVSTSA